MAISIVQVQRFTASNSGTLSTPTTSGNTLIVAYAGSAGAGSTGTCSTSGITLGGVALVSQIELDAPGSASASCSAIYMGKNIASGQTAIVVSGTNLVAADAYFVVWELSGMGSAPTLDISSTHNDGTGAGTTWTSDAGSAPTTTTAVEFWVGVHAAGPNSAQPDNLASTGAWTSQTDFHWGAPGGASIAGAQITSATGSLRYNGTAADFDFYTTVVAAFAPSGSATSAQNALPGPAWSNQFGTKRARNRRAVLFDTQLPAIASVPGMAVPGPAWGNQFGPKAHKSKQPVLFDVYSQSPAWSSNYNGLLALSSLNLGVIVKGTASFPAPTVAGLNGTPDPSATLPSDAWQNQFGPFAHTSKRAVLFDVQASVFVSLAPVQAAANFPALTVAGLNGSPDPSTFSPSDSWQNQFGPLAHTSKRSVLFDVQASVFVTPSVVQGTATILDGLGGAFVATFPQANDPVAALPSEAWQNQFGPSAHTSKRAVLYDIQSSAFAVPVTVQGTANFPVPLVAGLNGSPDPTEFNPSDAWLNQFAHTTKHPVLFDVQASVYVTPNVVQATATVLDGLSGAVVAGLNTSPDPQSVLPGPAWQNQFGPFAHTSKRAVEYDIQSSGFAAPSVIEGIATVIDGNSTTVVSSGAGVIVTPVEGIASFPAFTVAGLNGIPDPSEALYSPAWQNQFGPFAHTSKRSVLWDAQVSAIVAPAVIEGIASFPAPFVSAVSPLTDPPVTALPGPAWSNQFGPFSHTSKRAVLYDTQSSAFVVYTGTGILNANPFFLNGTSGWAGFQGALTVSSNPPAGALFPQCAHYVNNGVTVGALEGTPAAYAVTPNATYYVSAWVRSSAANVQIGFDWRNSNGVFTSSSIQQFFIAPNTWTLVSATFGAPGNAVTSYPRVGSGTLGATLDIAAVIAYSISPPSVVPAVAIFPAPVVAATNGAPDPDRALPGPAWRNYFGGAFGKLSVQYDKPGRQFYGPFCFAGTDADTNLYGGTATDSNAGLGGTATDVNAGLGGTEANKNPYTGAGVLGYGGTETDTNLYGGTFTDTNQYGGTEYGGCFN